MAAHRQLLGAAAAGAALRAPRAAGRLRRGAGPLGGPALGPRPRRPEARLRAGAEGAAGRPARAPLPAGQGHRARAAGAGGRGRGGAQGHDRRGAGRLPGLRGPGAAVRRVAGGASLLPGVAAPVLRGPPDNNS